LLEAIDAKGQSAITHEIEPAGLEGLDWVCFSSQIGFPLAEDGTTAKPLHILKWGANEPVDGRPTLEVDETFASKLAKAFDKRKVELAIDRNHASLRGFGDPSAAGWIKALRIEKPAAGEATKATHGVWLVPEWTPRGLQEVRDGEFKYMSAALAMDQETRNALPELLGAGLTNTPAIHGLKVVAASAERNGRGSEMEGKDVLKELGFATLEEAKAALDDRDAKAQEVTALKAKVVEFEAKVKTLTEQVSKAAVDAAMSQAETAGRIPKDSEKLSETDKKARAFARSLAEKDLVLFGQWVAAAQPVIPSPAGRLTLATPPEGDGEEGVLEKEVRAYAAEHKCALGVAYEAIGAKHARAGKAAN
jgi:phage I-like protein